jgi:hypothetical protein
LRASTGLSKLISLYKLSICLFKRDSTVLISSFLTLIVCSRPSRSFSYWPEFSLAIMFLDSSYDFNFCISVSRDSRIWLFYLTRFSNSIVLVFSIASILAFSCDRISIWLRWVFRISPISDYLIPSSFSRRLASSSSKIL